MASASRVRIGLGNALTIYRASSRRKLVIQPAELSFGSPDIETPGIQLIPAELEFSTPRYTFWAEQLSKRDIEPATIEFEAADRLLYKSNLPAFVRLVEAEITFEPGTPTVERKDTPRVYLEAPPDVLTFEASDLERRPTHVTVGITPATIEFEAQYPRTNPEVAVIAEPATIEFDAERRRYYNRTLILGYDRYGGDIVVAEPAEIEFEAIPPTEAFDNQVRHRTITPAEFVIEEGGMASWYRTTVQIEPAEIEFVPFAEIESRPNYRKLEPAEITFEATEQLDRWQEGVPAGLSDNLVLWHDATRVEAADGATLTRWTDLTMGGLNAVQFIPGLQPRYRRGAINGLPAIEFDGLNDFLELEEVYDERLNTEEFTLFMVVRPRRTDRQMVPLSLRAPDTFGGFAVEASAQGTWAAEAGNGQSFSRLTGASMEPGEATLISLRRVAGRFYHRVVWEQSQMSLYGYAANPKFPLYLGADRNSYENVFHFDGYIGEVLLYNVALTTADVIDVEVDLRRKWGIKVAHAEIAPAEITFEAQTARPFSTIATPFRRKPVFHFDADYITLGDGAPVAAWDDIAGSGLTLSKDTAAAPQLVKSAIGGHAAVAFTGERLKLQEADFGGRKPSHTLFVVFKAAAAAGRIQHLAGSSDQAPHDTWAASRLTPAGELAYQYGYYQPCVGCQYSHSGKTISPVIEGAVHVAGLVHKAGTTATDFFLDNRFVLDDGGASGLPDQSASGSQWMSPFYVGNRGYGDQGFHGLIAEIILFDDALSVEDLRQVTQYLVGKYGLEIPSVAELEPVPTLFELAPTDPMPTKPQMATAEIQFTATVVKHNLTIPDPALWLAAEDAQTNEAEEVVYWPDRSGGGYDTEPEAALRPRREAASLKNRPAVRFQGGDGLRMVRDYARGPYSFFIVAEPEEIGAGTAFGEGAGDCNTTFLDTTFKNDSTAEIGWNGNCAVVPGFGYEAGRPYILSDRSGSVRSGGWMHGVHEFWVNTESKGLSGIAGFRNFPGGLPSKLRVGPGFRGRIAEIIAYQHELTDFEVELVHAYLGGKYLLAPPVTKAIEPAEIVFEASPVNAPVLLQPPIPEIEFMPGILYLRSSVPVVRDPIPAADLQLDASALRIYADGAKVPLWDDKTFNGRAIAQTDPLLQPTYVAAGIGGKAAVRFRTGELMKSLASGLGGAQQTVYAVLRTGATSDQDIITTAKAGGYGWSLSNTAFKWQVMAGQQGTSTWKWIAGRSISTDADVLARLVFDGTNGRLETDDVETASAFSYRANPDGLFQLGADTVDDVLVAEVLVWNRVLTVEEEAEVESYLKAKYDVSNPYDLLDVPRPDGHWDANALTLTDGAAVAAVTDLSGAGRNLSGAATFAAAAIGGKAAFRFNGAQGLTLPADAQKPIRSNEYTVFAVAKPRVAKRATVFGMSDGYGWAESAWGGLFTGFGGESNYEDLHYSFNGGTRTGKDSYGRTTTNVFSAGMPHLVGLRHQAGKDYADIYADGIKPELIKEAVQTTVATGGEYAWSIGRYGDGSFADFDGDIAEVLLYNRALSDAEVDKVTRYLKTKYGFDFVAAIDPIPAPDLQLDASTLALADGAPVLDWHDKNGRGITATALGAPTYVASGIYEQPAIAFDGNDDAFETLKALGDTASPEYTVFSVFQPQALAGLVGIYGDLASNGANAVSWAFLTAGSWSGYATGLGYSFGNGSAYNYGGTSAGVLEVGQPAIIRHKRAAGSVADQIYKNGQPLTVSRDAGTATQAGAVMTNFCIGRAGAYNTIGRFNGLIAEVIVYKRALSEAECQQVESYLMGKYAAPAPDFEDVPAPDVHLDASALALADGASLSAAFADAAGVNVTPAGSPVLRAVAIGGKPAIEFNGSTAALDYGTVLGTPATWTVFSVSKTLSFDPGGAGGVYGCRTGGSGVNSYMGVYETGGSIMSSFGNGSGYTFTSSPGGVIVQNVPLLLRQEHRSGEAFERWTKNGGAELVRSASSTGVVAPANLHPFAVGRFGSETGYNWHGQMAELIVYKRTLSAEEIAAVEAYLKAKYNIA